MYLLDTNVVSELRKSRPHGAVAGWFSQTVPGSIFLPGVVVGEIQIGAERTRASDPAKATEIEAWLDEVILVIPVLPMRDGEFRLWARFMHKRPSHLSADAMIAATASINDCIVVTRNVADFEPFGVRTFNPFADG